MIFFRYLSYISIVLSLVIISGMTWLRTSLPKTAGTVSVTGLSAEVIIRRDLVGIPHIESETESDAYFGLGYAHAQDRLWQMEVSRRAGAGRLSEIFGDRTLNADKYLRGLGIYKSSEESLLSFSETSLSLLQSYSDGINAYLSSHKGAWPLEFIILNHQPEVWKPADSIACAKMMAHQLSGNAGDEFLRYQLLNILNINQVNELWGIPSLRNGITDQNIFPTLLPLMGEFPKPGKRILLGSNNWVIDGRHTINKKPILASDPHLGLTAPSPWYLAHLSSPTFQVAGGTLPGIPVVIIGRNRTMAWGVTNTGPDVQDLFIEKRSDLDPDYYVTDTGVEKFQNRTETIKIKDKEDFQYIVRTTRHGPIISDFSTLYNPTDETGTAISFSWTALAKNDTTLQAGFNLARAASWNEFTTALSGFIAPQQNFIAAHINGDIGFIAPGRIPIRRMGTGWLPAPGWSREGDWVGVIPPKALPQNLNPERGIIVTANQDITPNDYPYFLSHDWATDYRFDRINELLLKPKNHSVDGFKSIQIDIVSLMALDFKDWILRAGFEQDLHEKLKDWDGSMDMNAFEPLLFHTWYRELTRLIYADELGSHFIKAWQRRPKFLRHTLRHNSKWCDNVTTAALENCEDMIQIAADQAIKWLEANYGANPEKWKWKNSHIAHHKHSAFSDIPVLGDLFDIKHPHSGGPYTVMQANTTLRDDESPFKENHGAALRAIFDLSHLDNSSVIISTGQSGNRLSKHYASLNRLWDNGEYVNLPLTLEKIEKITRQKLFLVPLQ